MRQFFERILVKQPENLCMNFELWKQCLRACVYVCVCGWVCPPKILKNSSSRVAKAFTDVTVNEKTISIIILGHFCTWYKSRRFFTPLFQLLPIIGFVAPPLSKSHVVVTVSNATRTPIRENTGGIDLASYGEARGVSIPWIHSSWTRILITRGQRSCQINHQQSFDVHCSDNDYY